MAEVKELYPEVNNTEKQIVAYLKTYQPFVYKNSEMECYIIRNSPGKMQLYSMSDFLNTFSESPYSIEEFLEKHKLENLIKIVEI